VGREKKSIEKAGKERGTRGDKRGKMTRGKRFDEKGRVRYVNMLDRSRKNVVHALVLELKREAKTHLKIEKSGSIGEFWCGKKTFLFFPDLSASY